MECLCHVLPLSQVKQLNSIRIPPNPCLWSVEKKIDKRTSPPPSSEMGERGMCIFFLVSCAEIVGKYPSVQRHFAPAPQSAISIPWKHQDWCRYLPKVFVAAWNQLSSRFLCLEKEQMSCCGKCCVGMSVCVSFIYLLIACSPCPQFKVFLSY